MIYPSKSLLGIFEQIAHRVKSQCSNPSCHVTGNICSGDRDLYMITLSKYMVRSYSQSVARRTHYTKQWTELCT